MFIIFEENDLSENLKKFNQWGYLNTFIKNNENLFSNEAKQFLAKWPYASGFGNSEEWVLENGEIICRVLQENRNEVTKRWAEPIIFINQPWIAMPLPDEWETLPQAIREEALEKLGHGRVVNSLTENPRVTGSSPVPGT